MLVAAVADRFDWRRAHDPQDRPFALPVVLLGHGIKIGAAVALAAGTMPGAGAIPVALIAGLSLMDAVKS